MVGLYSLSVEKSVPLFLQTYSVSDEFFSIRVFLLRDTDCSNCLRRFSAASTFLAILSLGPDSPDVIFPRRILGDCPVRLCYLVLRQFLFAAHLSRIAFILGLKPRLLFFASFSLAFLAPPFRLLRRTSRQHPVLLPLYYAPLPCYMERFLDSFSISSSSVRFLSWRSFLFPQCFGHPLGLFTLCHDFIPFLLQRLKFLLPGLSFVSRCFEMFLFGGHPTLPLLRTSAQIRMHLDGVKRCGLDTFPGGMVVPVRVQYGPAVRFRALPPANAPRRPWMAICTRVTPNTLLESFPKFLQLLPWSYPL